MPIAHVSTYSITVEHYDFGIFFPPPVLLRWSCILMFHDALDCFVTYM